MDRHAAACCSQLRPAIWLVAVVGGCSQMNSQSLNSEGVRLYQSGSYQAAATKFEQAIANDPRSATSYYNLAAAMHQNAVVTNRPQDLAQAERLYNQCLEYDPNNADCYRGLAVLLTQTNRPDAASRLLQGWAQRSPGLADPHVEMARLLEESNRADQATSELVTALSIDPYNARALAALGRLREKAGDPAQALANYQRSLAVNRFQPDIQARVAALQASGVAGLPVAPGAPGVPPTRTVQQTQPSVRY
jgi:tetratricopeptide (TPR) repeat protein